MSDNKADETLERLRADYDVAFRNWTAQVRVYQSVSNGNVEDRGAIAQARSWADEAAAVYRQKRDDLLEFVIASKQSHSPSSANPTVDVRPADGASFFAPLPEEKAHRVERLARQIWEEAGRPSGTAESDWRAAEEILHTRL